LTLLDSVTVQQESPLERVRASRALDSMRSVINAAVRTGQEQFRPTDTSATDRDRL
jgi:hypothetical protein